MEERKIGKVGITKMAFSRKQKKAFLTAAVTAGVYLSFRYLLPLVFPFLAAYLMALFLRPSAAFLEKRLRISFRGRTIGIPIGVIGGVELILLCILLFVLLAAGGRRFMEELERFLEELPGRMEELSLLGGQFEQSAERFLHLPAGRLGQLFRGTGLQGGGQVKEILLPQLLQKSVPAAARIVRAVVVVVLFFIASILSLQEMDELRRRRFDSMFHREFFLLGRRLAVTGSAWLKTQSVIFLMTSSLSMLGLLLIGNPYYILGGIGIGVLDALPIFGTGTALVPWSILLLFKREWGHALILFGLYLLCYFLREFTEAHLMGKKMGLSPLETLQYRDREPSIFVGSGSGGTDGGLRCTRVSRCGHTLHTQAFPGPRRYRRGQPLRHGQQHQDLGRDAGDGAEAFCGWNRSWGRRSNDRPHHHPQCNAGRPACVALLHYADRASAGGAGLYWDHLHRFAVHASHS